MPEENKVDIKRLLQWASEAQAAHEAWRKESWEDCAFRDGDQWDKASLDAMKTKNITPLTINRIFPVVNLIRGNQANNQQDIIARGRTQHDNEISQVMSESIAFVMDQNGGRSQLSDAFDDQIVPGFGAMEVGLNPDPRKEQVMVQPRPWYTIWWDPFASPWMETSRCRYAFYADWKDLDDVIALFPKKKAELTEHFGELINNDYTGFTDVYDEGTRIEELKAQLAGSRWASSGERKRVRPIEMWYTVMQKAAFAIFPDHAVELPDTMPAQQQYEIIKQAGEWGNFTVRKMRTATFLGKVLLQDVPTPYAHDEFPFVPFVGYLDRYNFPYGVPRQIKEQNMEVNKRRAMALSLLQSRRVTMEKSTAEDPNRIYEAANRPDGLMIVEDGKIGTLEVEEMAALAPAQVEMLLQSEQEIKEIAGANDESLGYKSNAQSGVALTNKQQQSSTMTATLTDNMRRSRRMLGERIAANIQDKWTSEKSLRVTDRVTGTEKFVKLNEKVQGDNGIEVRNNLSEGRFDIVISDAPMSDTMREKNMDMIFGAIQKSPPEAIAPLISLALELSDLPQKDQLLKQIRSVLGVDALDTMLSSDELEQKEVEKQQARDDQQAQEADLVRREREADIGETEARIQEILSKAQNDTLKAQTDKQKVDQEGWEKGMKIAQDLNSQRETTRPRFYDEATA